MYSQERINLRQEIEALKAGKERADKEIAHVHAEMQTMTNKAAIDAKVRASPQNLNSKDCFLGKT